ncbi:MFS transporter [Colwellia sp. MB02u-10]|uniref:MFS transporter n=1 Tax=Colwellia sp. MB02u-10 TaxID=2759828 RepID=UPI0015F3C746|nr:MFS transporter [Colwellia sp. MB02u-10]MBA6339537.1 MFS transporter [Colwellia sp. MB02u-10]
MRQTFMSLFSLFLSCFILLLGIGLINVLLPVRMNLDGLSTESIGIVLSLYYVGLLIGALYSTSLIKRAGHIRMFAGCVSLGAVSILICSLYSEAMLWGAMRIVMGFCIACAFTAMESWLSDSSSKETRGQILAIYNAVVLAGLFGGQFFINVANPQDNMLFVIAGILMCIAIIPVVLSRHFGPVVEEFSSMSLRLLYKRSPLGVVSCFISGILYSAVFSLLPVFAKAFDITGFQLSLYMGAAIFGAFILQFPVGFLSDRFDRRTVLLVLLLISASAGIAVTILAPLGITWAVFLATAITCGIIACTYPLSITEALDKLRQSEIVAAMSSMILAFALGGVLGPYSASLVMDKFGGDALFYFLAFIQLLLACFVVFRMTVRQALPIEEQEQFVMQGSVISSAVELDPRTEYHESQYRPCAEVETTLMVAETDPALAVALSLAVAKVNAERGIEVAEALAILPNINVLNMFQAMSDILPEHIAELTLALVTVKPELSSEIAKLTPSTES